MLIPACYARATADKIAGSEFLLVPSCGHNPLVEKPEIVVPRIIEFLSRSTSYSEVSGNGDKLVLEEMV